MRRPFFMYIATQIKRELMIRHCAVVWDTIEHIRELITALLRIGDRASSEVIDYLAAKSRISGDVSQLEIGRVARL